MTLIFVYGTLKKGGALDLSTGGFEVHSTFIGEAKTRGGKFKIASCAGGYPILWRDEAGGDIEGECWDVKRGLFDWLDSMEKNVGYEAAKIYTMVFHLGSWTPVMLGVWLFTEKPQGFGLTDDDTRVSYDDGLASWDVGNGRMMYDVG